MRVRGFASSVGFAAVAALALVVAEQAFAWTLGPARVMAWYWVVCLVCYSVLIVGDARRRARNGLVAAIAGLVVVCFVADPAAIALGLTVVLAGVRSGLDPETRSVRAFWLEGLVGAGALLFASALESPSWLGAAAALWGYGLVQSLHGLLSASRSVSLSGKRSAEQGDPFDQARARLLRLLEEM